MNAQLNNTNTNDKWFYMIVQNPGTAREEFVGYNDAKTDEKFIPVFNDKKSAEKCFTLMPKDVFKEEYEIQAVISDDVMAAAKENGHRVYLLSERGKILDFLN